MLMELAVTLGAWLILLVVSTNLIGLLVRGFFTNQEMDTLAAEGHDFIKGHVEEYYSAQRKMNVFALVLIMAFVIALYYFWNIGVVVAALIMIASRIPDLIWELKHGRKLRMRDMSRPSLHVLSMILSWASLPVLWYALYRM
jgi:hypothetical protein